MIINEIGKLFPPAVTTVGYVLLILGVLFTLVNPLLGNGLVLIGIFVAFAKKGVEIDPDSRRLRNYTGLFNIKIGEWESMEDFSDIAVLRKRITTTAFSRANRPATTSDDLVHDVCLLDKTHRRKRVIQRLIHEKASIESAIQLAKTLGLTYGAYNPEMSAETRAKRRK
jgi:hypothetical protein